MQGLNHRNIQYVQGWAMSTELPYDTILYVCWIFTSYNILYIMTLYNILKYYIYFLHI